MPIAPRNTSNKGFFNKTAETYTGLRISWLCTKIMSPDWFAPGICIIFIQCIATILWEVCLKKCQIRNPRETNTVVLHVQNTTKRLSFKFSSEQYAPDTHMLLEVVLDGVWYKARPRTSAKNARPLCFYRMTGVTTRTDLVWHTGQPKEPGCIQVNDARAKDLGHCKPRSRVGN